MKKLMTMLSATVLAIGAYADEPTWPQGTSFESEAEGAGVINENGSVSLNGPLSWNVPGWAELSEADREALNTKFEVKDIENALEDEHGKRPSLFDYDLNNKYLDLKVKMGTVLTCEPTEKLIPTADTDYYVDMAVKFVACDDDMHPMATISGDNKLAVWVRNNEDESKDLIVYAGSVDAEGNHISTGVEYVCDTSATALDGSWHRLTVKGIKSIGASGGFSGFVVFIDNQPVSVRAGQPAVIGKKDMLNDLAAAYDEANQLFVSLISNQYSIKGIALSGQGGVDDVVFTQTLPGKFAEDPKPTVAMIGEQKFTDMAEAFAALNSVEAAATLVMRGDYAPANGVIVINNPNVAVTIDLNGNTIDGGIEAISDLVIKNSGDALANDGVHYLGRVTGFRDDNEDYSGLSVAYGAGLTIEGGYFIGMVDTINPEGEDKFYVTGGQFSETAEKARFDEGYGAVELEGGDEDEWTVGEVETEIAVTGIALNETAATLEIGGKITLTATVAPADATDKTVVWTSSDEDVATVADGVVTAVAAGEATITATAGGFSATCSVTVNAAQEETKLDNENELEPEDGQTADELAETINADKENKITVPAGVEGAAVTTYLAHVAAIVKDGKVVLDVIEDAVKPEADDYAKDILEAVVEAADATAATVTTDSVKGLFYTVYGCDDLKSWVNAASVEGNGSKINLKLPTINSESNARFYKVGISVKSVSAK